MSFIFIIFMSLFLWWIVPRKGSLFFSENPIPASTKGFRVIIPWRISFACAHRAICWNLVVGRLKTILMLAQPLSRPLACTISTSKFCTV